jgi:imidazolonepropionase-like amidohydrolase
MFVAPAVGLLYTRTYEAESFGITRSGPKNMGAAVHLERMRELYPQMRKRGIRVLPGGDYGFPYNPIGTNARDLEWFVELLGYTATEALVAATRLGGELMGREPLGQVRPGYLADLLLVDGDPTVDVRLLQDHEKLRIVMKDGKIHKSTQPIH